MSLLDDRAPANGGFSDATARPDAELVGAVTDAIAADPGLSQTGVAGALGASPSAFSQWLRGVYKGDNRAMNDKARRWLALRAQGAQFASQLPADLNYYETETSQRIWGRLAFCHLAPDIGVIDGAAGVGKTCTARRYAESFSGVWMVTMSPDCSGVMSALEEIAAALEIDVQGGAAAHRRAIHKRLSAAAGQGLLIIDEAQHLSVAALDEIRTLHDRAAIGIAYVGNEGVWSQLVGGGRRGVALDRLHSRVGARAHCKGPTLKDIGALLDAWAVTDKGARALITEIARRPGALRAATKAVRAARIYADGAPTTAEHIRAAQQMRGV